MLLSESATVRQLYLLYDILINIACPRQGCLFVGDYNLFLEHHWVHQAVLYRSAIPSYSPERHVSTAIRFPAFGLGPVSEGGIRLGHSNPYQEPPTKLAHLCEVCLDRTLDEARPQHLQSNLASSQLARTPLQ